MKYLGDFINLIKATAYRTGMVKPTRCSGIMSDVSSVAQTKVKSFIPNFLSNNNHMPILISVVDD